MSTREQYHLRELLLGEPYTRYNRLTIIVIETR